MLGGPRLRQHIVEFIRGVGIVTDGVVDATDTTGPFSWTVPEGVCLLEFSGAGPGQAGMGGAVVSAGITSAGGGCGGGSGQTVKGARIAVRPLSTLTITVPAGGSATAAGGYPADLTQDTTIVGSLEGPLGSTGSGITLRRNQSYAGDQPTASNGGQGLGSNGQTGDAPGDQGVPDFRVSALGGGISSTGGGWSGAAQGGAGNSDGSVEGYDGGVFLNYQADSGPMFGQAEAPRAAGTTDGTVSRGGGGRGVFNLFGRGGAGGSGGPGEDSPSWGGGGGGGAGGYGGGAGGDGYVQFIYWSVD